LEYAAMSIIFFFYKHRKVDLQCSIEIRIIRCSNKKIRENYTLNKGRGGSAGSPNGQTVVAVSNMGGCRDRPFRLAKLGMALSRFCAGIGY